jgi:hypothetical protein
MAKRIAVKDLRAGSIEATPIHLEEGWSGVLEAYGEGGRGTFWEAQECDECGEVLVFADGGGDEKHHDLEDSSECQGYFGRSEGPVMNYWYAVDLSKVSDPDEAAKLIADLPLCVVEIEGQYGLALTGGGMDLSWEICEAYTRLGQLPPVHFCDLPRMSGRGEDGRDRYIISACRESARVQMGWLKNKMRDLREMGKRKA